MDESTERTKSSSSVAPEENRLTPKDADETGPLDTFQIGEAVIDQDQGARSVENQSELKVSKSNNDLSYPSSLRGGTVDTIQQFPVGCNNGS